MRFIKEIIKYTGFYPTQKYVRGVCFWCFRNVNLFIFYHFLPDANRVVVTYACVLYDNIHDNNKIRNEKSISYR